MSEANRAQIELWDGRVGQKWAALRDSLDYMLAPLTAELAARAGPLAGRRVLDIGCGAGETCALWLERGASVTGVDVSSPMLAEAAKRTGDRVTLIRADASKWCAAEPFDLAVSRFGLMFFDDPGAAFANIARSIRGGGRLLFCCWRAAALNQWASVPLGAIRDLLPETPPPAAHAPGPFALADADRLRAILVGAGFRDVSISPFEFPVCFAREGGVDAAVRFALQIGPAASALAELGEAVREQAVPLLGAALAPHERDGAVMLGGAAWIVEARRPY